LRVDFEPPIFFPLLEVIHAFGKLLNRLCQKRGKDHAAGNAQQENYRKEYHDLLSARMLGILQRRFVHAEDNRTLPLIEYDNRAYDFKTGSGRTHCFLYRSPISTLLE
jgi:hypothetical protein